MSEMKEKNKMLEEKILESAEEYKKQENEEVNEDLVLQAYILSQGLKSKYCSLEWAMRGVFVELILMFVILILIICL